MTVSTLPHQRRNPENLACFTLSRACWSLNLPGPISTVHAPTIFIHLACFSFRRRRLAERRKMFGIHSSLCCPTRPRLSTYLRKGFRRCTHCQRFWTTRLNSVSQVAQLHEVLLLTRQGHVDNASHQKHRRARHLPDRAASANCVPVREHLEIEAGAVERRKRQDENQEEGVLQQKSHSVSRIQLTSAAILCTRIAVSAHRGRMRNGQIGRDCGML